VHPNLKDHTFRASSINLAFSKTTSSLHMQIVCLSNITTPNTPDAHPHRSNITTMPHRLPTRLYELVRFHVWTCGSNLIYILMHCGDFGLDVIKLLMLFIISLL
jgi:hypothetical protein